MHICLRSILTKRELGIDVKTVIGRLLAVSGNDEKSTTPYCFGVGDSKRIDECAPCPVWRECVDVVIDKICETNDFAKVQVRAAVVQAFERELRKNTIRISYLSRMWTKPFLDRT